MASQSETESDEEFLDDPIQLIDFEQRRFAKPVDIPNVSELVIEVFDSDDELNIEKSASTPKLPDARINRKLVTISSLPVTFFDISRNIRLLNRCKPLSIELVNCDKHPWYFNKCLKQNKSRSDPDKEVYDLNKKNKGTSKDNTMIDEEGKRIKIRPVSSPYGNLIDSPNKLVNRKKQRTSSERDTSKKRENYVKEKAINEINPFQVDFKKNQGLIGMKITQSDDTESKTADSRKETTLDSKTSVKGHTKNDLKTKTHLSSEDVISKSVGHIISKHSEKNNSPKVNKCDKDIKKNMESQNKPKKVQRETLKNMSNAKTKTVHPKTLEENDQVDKYDQKSQIKPKSAPPKKMENTGDKDNKCKQKNQTKPKTAPPKTIEYVNDKDDTCTQSNNFKPKTIPSKTLENTNNKNITCSLKNQIKNKTLPLKMLENISDKNDKNNQNSPIKPQPLPPKILENTSKNNQKSQPKPKTVPVKSLEITEIHKQKANDNDAQSILFTESSNKQKPSIIAFCKEKQETEKTDASNYIGLKVSAKRISENDWAITTSNKVNDKKANDHPRVNNPLHVKNRKRYKCLENSTKPREESESFCKAEKMVEKGNVPVVPAVKKNNILNMRLFKPQKKFAKIQSGNKKTVHNAGEKAKTLINFDATKTQPPAEQNNNIQTKATHKNGNLMLNQIVKNHDLKGPSQKNPSNEPVESNHQLNPSVIYLGKTINSNEIAPEYVGCTIGKSQMSSYYVEKLAQMTQSEPQKISKEVSSNKINIAQDSLPKANPQIGSLTSPVIANNEQHKCYVNTVKNKTVEMKQKSNETINLCEQPSNPTSQIISKNINQAANYNGPVKQNLAKSRNPDVQKSNKSMPIIDNIVNQNPQNCKPPMKASPFGDAPVMPLHAQPQKSLVAWKSVPKILKNSKNKTGASQSQMPNVPAPSPATNAQMHPMAQKIIANQNIFVTHSTTDRNTAPINFSNAPNVMPSISISLSQPQNNVPVSNLAPPLIQFGPASSKVDSTDKNFAQCNFSNKFNGMTPTSNSFVRAPNVNYINVVRSHAPSTVNNRMQPTSVPPSQANNSIGQTHPIQTLVSNRDHMPKLFTSSQQNCAGTSHVTPHNFNGNTLRLMQPNASQEQFLSTPLMPSMGGQQNFQLRGLQAVEQQKSKLNTQESMQSMVMSQPRHNYVPQIVPPTCDIDFGQSITPFMSKNMPQDFNGQNAIIPQPQNVMPNTKKNKKFVRRIYVVPNNMLNTNAAIYPNIQASVPQRESPQTNIQNNFGPTVTQNLQPYSQRFQSPSDANMYGVSPLQSYVNSVPFYNNFPQNMNPLHPVSYQAPNCWSYPPPRFPPPLPPYPMQGQIPPQNQNCNTVTLNSIEGTIIGCNDTGPVRKINIHADNSKPEENQSNEMKSSKLLELTQPIIIQNATVGCGATIHIKQNDLNTQSWKSENPAITSNVDDKKETLSVTKSGSINETSEISESVNTKREMLEELTKITLMGSPNGSPKRPLPNNDKVPDKASSPTIVKRPRPGPLSKKPKLITDVSQKNLQLSPVAHKGYSPPILPIPTYQKALEILARADVANPRLLFMPEHEDESENLNSEPPAKITKRMLSLDENTNKVQVKKISLDEYKKRVPQPDGNKMAEGCKEGEQIDNIKIEIESENAEQDLGYDSADSTMKV